ncbi:MULTISPECIES: hypothetical protein [unclassified Mycobacterium]|uniref:hypothetical protein n=1 Tax=unclassified Mycobacterium TaxID=2642494 RepID=UPI0029C85C71|nr:MULTISPECIES: hypothetical protein [unclassified Mycobacterium]
MTSIPKPSGGRKDEMTAPPAAWPQADEDTLQQRSDALKTVRTELTGVIDTWNGKKSAIFNHNGWFGGASTAAEGQVDDRIQKMEALKGRLDSAIQFYDSARQAIIDAKNTIVADTDAAQQEIDKQEESIGIGDSIAQENEIERIVSTTLLRNTKTVSDAAADLDATFPGLDGRGESGPQTVRGEPAASPAPTPGSRSPGSGTNRLLGDVGGEDASVPATPVSYFTAPGRGPQRNPVENGGEAPASPVSSNPYSSDPRPAPSGTVGADGAPTRSDPGGSGMSPTMPGRGGPSGPSGSSSPSLGGHPSNPSPGNSANPPSQMAEYKQDASTPASAGGQPPLTPAEQQQRFMNDVAKGAASGPPTPTQPVMPAAAQAPVLPPQGLEPSAAAATGPSGGGASGPGGGGSSGGGGLSGGGSGGSGPAPIGAPSTPAAPPPMPLGAPATPPPAGPGGGGTGGGSGTPGSSVPTGPGVNPAAATNSAAAATAAPAPVPVSNARLERDTIAASAAGAAARRQRGGGNDALTLARRIGAALNVGVMDFGFFWVTGLCVDGTIVVANSYGLGYIPEGVNLPEQVQMATADESIPPAERAKWTTYPILAVQGWAQARSQKLRAVIATEAQFATFDPGTAKVILQPDDIPDTGKMQGRSRLEVIAPGAAARLASVSDVALSELLPPAQADTLEPTDNSVMLWFDVTKPLMSTMPDRGAAQLEALITYADHAQELALHRAHTATDGPSQRAAIADWVYWQHLAVLISDAINTDATV